MVVIGSIGGMPKALLIRQSTRPNSSSAFSTSATRESSSVMSVGTTSARRPCDADHLGHLLQPPLGAADQHQVGAHPGRLLAERAAQPGADAGQDDDLVLQERDRLVGVGDGRRVVGGGGGHGAKTRTCFSFGREREPDPSRPEPLLGWPVRTRRSTTRSRPSTPTTWPDFAAIWSSGSRGLFSGCWCVHFHHGVPDGRGEDEEQPRLQAAHGRRGRRARRAGLRDGPDAVAWAEFGAPRRAAQHPPPQAVRRRAAASTRPARLPDHLHQRDKSHRKQGLRPGRAPRRGAA